MPNEQSQEPDRRSDGAMSQAQRVFARSREIVSRQSLNGIAVKIGLDRHVISNSSGNFAQKPGAVAADWRDVWRKAVTGGEGGAKGKILTVWGSQSVVEHKLGMCASRSPLCLLPKSARSKR